MTATYDAHKNFASSLVATPPSPAASGTDLFVATGEGALFPTPPFNAVVCPVTGLPSKLNAEIIRVTAKSGDHFTTIARTQEGSNARAIQSGDRIYAAITAKALTDIELSYVVSPFPVLIHWPGGSSQATNITVTHGLGTTPSAVILTVQGASGFTLGPQPVYWAFNLTSTTFDVTAFIANGFQPTSAGQSRFWWAAYK